MSTQPAGSSGPVVVRRRLGLELRRLREVAGFRLDQVAAELEVSAAKISRIETGQSVAKTWDVRNLLTVYQVSDRVQRDEILAWVEQGKATGWWHPYSDVVPMNLDYFISLEAEARAVSMHAVLVPALLQTPAYARALLADMFADVDRIDDDELDGLVGVRLRRQQALVRDWEPLSFSVVLDEAALHRQVGNPDVMAEQLSALLATPETVELKVRPLTAPVRRFALSSFVIFHPRLSSLDATVVNIEAAGRESYFEDPSDAADFQNAFRRLWTESLSVSDSDNMIRNLASGGSPGLGVASPREDPTR